MRLLSECCSEDFKKYFIECTCAKNTRTIDEYVSYVNLICDKLCKDFMDIKSNDAQKYFNYLHGKLNDGKLTRKTIGVRLSCYRTIGQYLEDRVENYVNPFTKIERPEINADLNPNNIPTMQELDSLMTEARKDDKAFLIMALATRMGLSATSIISLNVGSIVEQGDKLFLHFTAKSDFKKDSYIQVPDDVCVILRKYLEKHKDDDNVLFRNNRGNRMNLQNVDKIFRDINKRTKLGDKDFTLKDFRSRAILEMAANGTSYEDLSSYTGLKSGRLETFYANTELISKTCPANLVNYRIIAN